MSGSNSSRPAVAALADEPLGLTVHSMPSPGEALGGDANAGRQRKRGRWQMALVLLCCAAPVIASYFTYYVIRPQSRSVFGELIDPQRPVPAVQARTPDGAIQPLAGLKGQWLIVAVGGGACDKLCEQQLYLQRQLRETLGREKDRVDRVWLVSDDAPIPNRLQAALEGATVLRVSSDALAQWLTPASGAAIGEHLYVVDPMGNWMMRFPARMDLKSAAKAKRDLDRLLRASSSWDQPGR
ncbi:hypothetical protein [uncultured Pseudacidovorax sp.]|uniref:hypothetical protein n=1 Tax=uncultured Pseudacidovorax sp. TaxID=679313 RepID=UPI0025D9A094|nr:hypothetical protein [uncultured Pseudacidovorax sp.]